MRLFDEPPTGRYVFCINGVWDGDPMGYIDAGDIEAVRREVTRFVTEQHWAPGTRTEIRDLETGETVWECWPGDLFSGLLLA